MCITMIQLLTTVQMILIIVALSLYHAALTAPQSESVDKHGDHEGSSKDFRLFASRRNRVFITLSQKITSWSLGICELASLLARQTPNGKFRGFVTKFLSQNGAVDRMELTIPLLVGIGMVIGGAALRLRCFRELDEMFTFGLGIRRNHRLVTSGPYSLVRHPAYTGCIIMYIGVLVWHTSRGSWMVESGLLYRCIGNSFVAVNVMWLFTVVYGLNSRMKDEELLLFEHFGLEWTNWAKMVPYRLVPFLY